MVLKAINAPKAAPGPKVPTNLGTVNIPMLPNVYWIATNIPNILSGLFVLAMIEKPKPTNPPPIVPCMNLTTIKVLGLEIENDKTSTLIRAIIVR